ncbi:hypothetical protein [Myxococcus sp. AS-1-15]|uniref:hypothetical protein n=1 Tax=Myxococcus sp. AS-1-15 TaxID=2874600 RepID=UPI001CBC1242|nr:hypothetical protein [Myxococcus sp. AS-1-15]MBZ4402449.1 hypothetical protein [Myxococcus sp. AS-1-15]
MAQKKQVMGDGTRLALTTVAGQIAGPAGPPAVRMVETAIQWRRERGQRRAEHFAREFMESGYPNETARVELEVMLANPELPTKNVIIDAVRQLDDLVSDEVIPSLALLTREYVRAGRPKDRFFASVVRVLRDIEDGEFALFRKLVAAVARASPNRHTGRLHIAKVEEEATGRVYLWADPNIELEWDDAFAPLMRSLVANEMANVATGLALRVDMADGWVAVPETWMQLHAALASS